MFQVSVLIVTLVKFVIGLEHVTVTFHGEGTHFKSVYLPFESMNTFEILLELDLAHQIMTLQYK